MSTNDKLSEAISAFQKACIEFGEDKTEENSNAMYAARRDLLLSSQPSQPMPEAVPHGHALAMAVLQSDLYHKLDDIERAQCDAMLSASPAAPEGVKPEREIEQLIRERDQRDEIIDRLCDAVLGNERPEWSSAYGFNDAVADVEERITQLHQLSVDKAWERFEQARSAQTPHPQPQAQGDPATEFAYSKYASSAARDMAILDEIERLREAIAKRDAALVACEKDAARYRHIRDGGNSDIRVCEYRVSSLGFIQLRGSAESIDARIDAAITHANQVLGRKEGV